ncbi:MAG: hypothetical protein K0R18_487 [Bacillales bacterium]|nr:hypothetical protein [Bacillales bacterium]
MSKIDIYCEKEICPICGSKMQTKESYLYRICCKNKCYEYVYWLGEPEVHTFLIFEEMVRCHYDEYKKETEIAVKEKINFWKENDRYLVKIMNV